MFSTGRTASAADRVPARRLQLSLSIQSHARPIPSGPRAIHRDITITITITITVTSTITITITSTITITTVVIITVIVIVTICLSLSLSLSLSSLCIYIYIYTTFSALRCPGCVIEKGRIPSSSPQVLTGVGNCGLLGGTLEDLSCG